MRGGVVGPMLVNSGAEGLAGCCSDTFGAGGGLGGLKGIRAAALASWSGCSAT